MSPFVNLITCPVSPLSTPFAWPINGLYISLLVMFRNFPTTAYIISSIYGLVACGFDNED